MRNRWVIAIAGTTMQIALGAVYAWSVFRKPLAAALGASTTEVNLAFTTTIVMLGLAAFVGGLWLPKAGPRVLGVIAAVLYGGGTFLAGFADQELLYLYGAYAIAGAGLGLGYIVPIATLVKWFPDRRGTITGIAVAGFGCGALIFGPVARALIARSDPFTTLHILGLVYFVLVLWSACLLRNPPTAAATRRRTHKPSVAHQLGEALRTPEWYAMWTLLFLSVTSGIALIAEAAPMAQQLGGANEVQAATLVGTIAVFNGAGRFVWAALSDVIGRRAVFVLLLLVQAAVFFLLSTYALTYEQFLALACVSLFCYGGGFGTMPAFAADYFGSRNVGKVYGLMLTAWGAGAIVGPMLLSRIHDSTGAYTRGLQAIAAFMAAGALVPLFVRRPQPVCS